MEKTVNLPVMHIQFKRHFSSMRKLLKVIVFRQASTERISWIHSMQIQGASCFSSDRKTDCLGQFFTWSICKNTRWHSYGANWVQVASPKWTAHSYCPISSSLLGFVDQVLRNNQLAARMTWVFTGFQVL